MLAVRFINKISATALILVAFFNAATAQKGAREFPFKIGGAVEIVNDYGRVEVVAVENDAEHLSFSTEAAASDLQIKAEAGKFRLEVVPAKETARIDLVLRVPERTRLKITTRDGEAQISGNFESAVIETATGTIAAEVPLDNLRYDFSWTASRPRFVSDVTLEEVREKAAGRFVVSGRLFDEEGNRTESADRTEKAETDDADSVENSVDGDSAKEKKQKKRKAKKTDNRIELNFTTARGIILLNVKPNEVPSDLSERKLTEAAKAVIRSGDSLLTDAIRRASPKFFGDYAKTLPPRKNSPFLSEKSVAANNIFAPTKQVLVRVTDLNNRAIPDLNKDDFIVQEAGEEREVLSVKPTTAPFNLILLVDVSGSVDNYIDFIRKAARDFVNTVDKNDKVAIVLFNEDVQVLSNFTIDKEKLSKSLDTFDAGGGTAYYDALAFALVDTLKPLKGERTAIVALTDGDDNRSFLPFDSLLGSIQESGALIYPLYVPSGLIAASATNDPNKTIDPLRTRYYGLTTKAESEGEKLAQISGGVYYPIQRLSQLQAAYDDIVKQLRAAYTVTFRSDSAQTNENRASPRLRVRVKRENSFVKLGSVTSAASNDSSQKLPAAAPELSFSAGGGMFSTAGEKLFGKRLKFDYLSPKLANLYQADYFHGN